MKRIYFSSYIILISLFGCNTSDDSVTDSITRYTYTTNSQIVTNESEGLTFTNIEEGDNLVFKYQFIKSQDDNISDDEYSETIIFQIDGSAQEFNYSDDQLEDISTYFESFCFCPYEGAIQIIDGTINGQKSDSQNWDITINVTFSINESTETKQISGIFKPE